MTIREKIAAGLAAVVAVIAAVWVALTKWRTGSAARKTIAEVKEAEAAEKKARDAATGVLAEAEARANKANLETAEALARPETSEEWSKRMGARDKP